MDANAHVLDFIAAYVLGSLSEPENVEVQEHLASCEICRGEARVYQTIVDELSEIVPQVSPPETLRTRLIQSIQGTSQPMTKPSSNRSRFDIMGFLRGWRIPALAGVGLVLILAVSNVLLWQQVNTLRAEIIDTEMIVQPLFPGEGNPSSTGIVVMDPRGTNGTIVIDSVPLLPDGQQYQVWLSYGEVIDSGGLCYVHENGYGAQVIYAPQPLLVYERIWITAEPEGGSEQPTGVVVLQTQR